MKQFALGLLLALSLTSVAIAYPFKAVPNGMQNQVGMLMNFPETRSILESLESQGAIELKWAPMGSQFFNACWVDKERVVALNASKPWKEEQKMFSMLFELHNAKSTPQFVYLDQLARRGQINQYQYIEAIETIEYQNMVSTNNLIQRGIYFGYFPQNTFYPFLCNFQDHLALQMQCGHSACIGKMYEELVRNAA